MFKSNASYQVSSGTRILSTHKKGSFIGFLLRTVASEHIPTCFVVLTKDLGYFFREGILDRFPSPTSQGLTIRGQWLSWTIPDANMTITNFLPAPLPSAYSSPCTVSYQSFTIWSRKKTLTWNDFRYITSWRYNIVQSITFSFLISKNCYVLMRSGEV